VFEISYTQVDDNLKIWFSKMTNVEVTIADGFSKHPYLTTGNMTFITKSLTGSDEFEVGDYFYNISTAGKAYLFIKCTSTYGYASFTYG